MKNEFFFLLDMFLKHVKGEHDVPYAIYERLCESARWISNKEIAEACWDMLVDYDPIDHFWGDLEENGYEYSAKEIYFLELAIKNLKENDQKITFVNF